MFRTYNILSKKAKLNKDKYNALVFGKLAIKWRTRAFIFAKALSEKSNQEERTSTYFPYSLMQGCAGVICLFSDLLTDENQVRFPCFEI
jgi:hypothetical protein